MSQPILKKDRGGFGVFLGLFTAGVDGVAICGLAV